MDYFPLYDINADSQQYGRYILEVYDYTMKLQAILLTDERTANRFKNNRYYKVIKLNEKKINQ